MKSKKIACFAASAILATSLLGGCSQKPETGGASGTNTNAGGASAPAENTTGVTLTVVHNMVGGTSDAIEEACNRFTAETGIGVEVQAPGSSYEEMLKTRMASNTLPDIWTTHGWSVVRYSEYLRPLDDQPFADKIIPSIKELILDDAGSFYTLPVNVELAGIMYNRDVVAECGIDVDAIHTWDDFTAALQQVSEAGYTALNVGGKDTWTIGQMYDVMAPGFYTTNDADNDRDALLDGTFDWQKWADVCNLMDDWNKNGYINVDCLTADYNTSAKALASGNVGFMLMNTYIVQDAQAVNPDVNIGLMPIPTCVESDPRFFIGGESVAFGMWKDGEHQEQSLELLNFLAREDVCSLIASATNMPAGIEGVESDAGMLREDFEKYADVRTISYFDRVYLPSGMWDDLSSSGALVLSGRDGAIEEAIAQMEQSYNDKFAQQG